METKVYSGKTKEEAIEIAIKELQVEEKDLIIKSLETKKTLLRKKEEIEVILRKDVVEYVKKFLLDLTEKMGIKTNIEYKKREECDYFNIITKDNSILIGKNGRTIDALQTIVNQVINNEIGSYIKIQIDVGDYKAKRQKRLEKLAKYTAKDVARSKCPIKLDAMNSYERRIIHSILSESKDVTTESIGEEPNRCVVIKPKED